jgi:cytochrome P450
VTSLTGTAQSSASVPESAGHGLRLVRALRTDPLPLLRQLRRDHGPVVRLRVPRLAVYLVSDPDAIQEAFIRTHHEYDKGWGRRGDPSSPSVQPLARALGQGLLTSGAQLHRRQRRLIQPMFHRERIEAYAASFVELARAAFAGWHDGDLRDVHREMAELTLAIVARTVFDVELDSDVAETIRRSLAENQATVRRSSTARGQLLDRLPVPSTRRWNASAREVNAMIYEMITVRRAAGVPGSDLLSLLLSARDETGETMPDRQVRDEALTLLLAGHETTANALAWALHLLANHPAEQNRVRTELAALPGPATVADLPRLRYTAAALHETMRLYPPAWTILRHLTEERTIGGYRLPAGATLMLSPWVVHRDARWWPQPQTFRPDRWLSGSPPHRYAYFPFGGGPRQCIGNDFAVTEATLVLATLLRDWRVEAALGTPPVRPLPLVTLRPRNGVWLTIRAS